MLGVKMSVQVQRVSTDFRALLKRVRHDWKIRQLSQRLASFNTIFSLLPASISFYPTHSVEAEETRCWSFNNAICLKCRSLVWVWGEWGIKKGRDQVRASLNPFMTTVIYKQTRNIFKLIHVDDELNINRVLLTFNQSHRL